MYIWIKNRIWAPKKLMKWFVMVIIKNNYYRIDVRFKFINKNNGVKNYILWAILTTFFLQKYFISVKNENNLKLFFEN